MSQNAAESSNASLISLLSTWGNDASEANFQSVVNELFTGTSSLLIPIEDQEVGGEEGMVQFASIFELEGLLVMGAFSTEQALLQWAQEPISYTTLTSQEVLDFCQEQGIGRIVINSNQPDMFVLEREMPNINPVKLEEDMQVRVGPLPEPLPDSSTEKLRIAFASITPVEAAYAYGQLYNQQMSCVLGIQATGQSANTTMAVQQAFNDALVGEQLPLPVSLLLLPNQEWIETVQGIPGAMFYQR